MQTEKISPAEVKHDARPRGIAELWLEQLPTLLVLAVLAGLGVWGVAFHWRMPKFSALWTRAAVEETEPGIVLSPEQEDIKDPLVRMFRDRKIAFPSEEAMKQAGIQDEPATTRTLAEYVTANGVIDYNQSRIAHLSTRASGIAWKVYRQVGQRVEKGDVLAVVESAEVGKAKADFLQYLILVDIKKKIYDRLDPNTVPERRIQEADAELREARIRQLNAQQTLINLGLPVSADKFAGLSEKMMTERVRSLGLPAEYAALLPHDEMSTNLIPLLAPFKGVVVGRDIVQGEIVTPQHIQFTVADLSTMWVMLDVRLEDTPALQLKQPVRFIPDGVPDLVAEGQLDWISTEVDEKTRTVRARVEVNNSEERLRARTFGTGHVRTRTVENAVAVSEDALQDEDGRHLVFVRLSPIEFESRLVKTGAREAGFVQIVQGVSPGEKVVTTGSHALKSEILKGRIGGED